VKKPTQIQKKYKKRVKSLPRQTMSKNRPFWIPKNRHQ
jgi:hypothetical protein